MSEINKAYLLILINIIRIPYLFIDLIDQHFNIQVLKVFSFYWRVGQMTRFILDAAFVDPFRIKSAYTAGEEYPLFMTWRDFWNLSKKKS